VVLLDLGLPDRDGSEVLTDIRAWSSVPVIILSVRESEAEIVRLLESGADDYICKPFGNAELSARIEVALRHRRPDPKSELFSIGSLEIDFGSRLVRVAGKEPHLTPTEYSILAFLCRYAGRIVTQSEILKELWGPISEAEAGNLRVHISALRKKIEDPNLGRSRVITEPGIGYRLDMTP
jgi:two-component system KDP operon response regulator KdpE